MDLKRIHGDFRGSIFALENLESADLKEIVILNTNAGYARGGCIHLKSEEHLVVIKGRILYHYIFPNEMLERIKPLKDGEGITIPANTAHYYVSDTDSIVMEWGPSVDDKCNRHKEMRRMVDEHNRTV